ncbi:MAG: pilin [Planctomycetota bacterium]
MPRSHNASFPTIALAVAIAAAGSQQDCRAQTLGVLDMPPGQQVNSGAASVPLDAQLVATAGSAFVLVADIAPGPVDLLGERFYLGVSTNLVVLAGGAVPVGGTYTMPQQTLPVFPGLAGTTVYAQAAILDVAASNGVFGVSTAAETTYWSGNGAIVAPINLATLNGYTGTFREDVLGQIRGAPITTRTVEAVDTSAVQFTAGVASPFQPAGCREQVVYRASDVAATGAPETLVAVRWKPFQGSVTADTIPQFELRLGHTAVLPDYTIDPWWAWPVRPDSGLAPSFVSNEIPGSPPEAVFSGAYLIDPANLRASGYLDYPMTRGFEYDGVSSLLVDFRVPSGAFLQVHGMTVRLMVPSSPLPGARNVAFGMAGQTLDPATVQDGQPDNALPEFEFEFAQNISEALSPWLDAQVAAPDYRAPIVVQHLPAGTSIDLEYRGASSATGATATAWSASPDIADGLNFLQFRATMRGNIATGEVPLLASVVIPF